MNKAFKVIWNHATQSWTAVSEIARAKGKTKSIKTAKTALAVAVATAGIASASPAMAAIAAEPILDSTGKYVTTGTSTGSDSQYLYMATNRDNNTIVIGGGSGGSSGIADARAETGGTAIGAGSYANSGALALGFRSNASGSAAISIGWGALAQNNTSIAVGSNVNATGNYAIAVGEKSTATGDYGVAVGTRSNATTSAAAYGMQSRALKDFSVAVGTQTEANATEGSVAIGWSAGVSDGATSGVAVGPAAKSNGERSIAMGRSVHANGTYSVAVGTGTAVRGEGSSTVGYSNVIGSTSSDASAFGSKNLIGATAIFAATGITQSATIADATAVTNSKVVGNNNYISSSNTYVLGSGVGVKDDGISFMDTVENSVYLGNDSTITSSTATIDAATAGTVKNLNTNGDAGATSTAGSKGTVTEANVSGLVYGDFAGATSVGAVSVGASGSERRIVNMAAGEISATSTDAINGSQLYATNEVLGHFYKSTVDALGGKVSPDTPNTANFTLSYNLTSNDPSNSTPDQVEYTSIGDALTALSQAVNQPLTFTANTNADTGANGTQQELGSSIAIIGSKTNKALTENTDAAVGSTYSAKNIQTVVTDNQVQIQMTEQPEFKEITVKADDADTNPVVISSGAGNTGGKITNIEGNLVGAKTGDTAPTTKQAAPTAAEVDAMKNNAATVGDVLNAGWNLKTADKGDLDFVKPYDTVEFLNGVGTTIKSETDGKVNKIQVDVNLTDPNLTTTVGDTTRTDGSTGTDGKIDTPAATDGDKLVNATTVVNAINASGWNVYQDDTNVANKIDTVNPGNNVVFKAGTNTTVKVDSDGTTTNVTYDIDLSKINDALDKTDLNVSTAPTAANNGTPTGKVETPAAGDATKLVNAGDIVEAINNSGFTLKSSATAEGTKDPASTGDELINPGDVIEMVAGKNMTVKQAANGTITYSTKDSVVFDNVNVTSKLPVTSINVGEKAAKTATDLLDLTTAAKNTPDAVVTAKDLANYGWVVATPDNGYDAAVKSANTVNFIGDGGVVVNGETNATTGAYDVVVKLSAAGSIEIANMTTANGTTEPSGKLAVDENETGFITAGNVVNIINQSGWRTNSTTATGTAKETLVNPGDQVNFEAGNNMQVTQEINTTTGVISYTYATKDDLVLNSTTVNSTTIGGSYTNEAGKLITTSPITIMTTPEGKNVINNLTTVLPPTTSIGDKPTKTPTKDDGSPFTAQDAQDLAKTSGTNAATLGDVLNAGWNLQGNGEAVDFVKPYDTVNFKNGEGTTAVVGSDGNVSTIQYNVNVDGKTTQITYVNAKGDQVTKVGDKFYNPSDLNADGTPKAGATPVENVTSQISAIGPKVNGNATTGNINFANSTTANISYNSTTGDVKVEVVTGDTTVENGKATVKEGDEGKIATVSDIVETINNVSWNAAAGKVANSTGEVAGSASTAVKAGDTVTLNAGNNIRIEQDGKTFNISTTDNVSFKNMNVTGNTTLGNLTVQPNSTVNMGGNVITNVGAGTNGTDAVNLNQLNASVAAAKTEVTSTDKTVTVTQNSGASGQTIYDLSVKTDSTTIKPNATTGALEVVTGKTTTTKDGKAGLDGANATDIATVGDIVNTINNVSWNATAGKVAGTNGEVKGNAAAAVKAGDTVTLNAGNNIRIEQDGKTFNISTTDNVSFTTANATTVNVGGDAGNTALTTVAGGNYNSEGQKIDDTAVPALSVGGNQITNVANGAISPSSTDAINGSQLYALQSNINNQIGDVNNRIGDLDKNRKAGSASAMAAAGLPQAYREGQSGIVAALGQYEGETGVAVGFTSISDNGKWLFRGSYATNSQNENAGNLGIGYYW